MHQKQNLSKTEQSVESEHPPYFWYPKILPKLGKIKKLYRKKVQKESEPIDVPAKNVKSRTTAKVSILHRTNQQAL